jgi:large subunit ribosomal protein L13Ae
LEPSFLSVISTERKNQKQKMVRHIGGAPPRAITDRRQRKKSKFHRPDIITVDLKGHVLGRAAAVIAKQLLLGKRITVVRADEANISGAEIRNKIKYLNFLRKRHQSNPKKGPFHHRSPSDVFCRVVRGMLPYYTKRGHAALRRLVAYEGIPVNVANKGTRYVIPKAESASRLRAERSKTVLGQMCQHIGWKYKPIVDKLETARKTKAARFHKRTQKLRDAWKKARKDASAKLSAGNVAVLKKFGAF